MGSAQNNKSTYPLYLAFVLILFLTLTLGITYLVKTGNFNKFLNLFHKQKVSPNILFLTTPVTEVNGKIDKISGNTLWVKKTYTQQFIYNSEKPPEATPPSTTITYKIMVTDKTKVFLSTTNNIPYLLKTIDSTKPEASTLKDLIPGEQITVVSATDLRTNTNNEFEAVSLQVNFVSNTITGRITGVESNKLKIRAIPPQSALSLTTNREMVEKDYTITVTAETEIARTIIGPDNKFVVKTYTLSDLKPNVGIVVYTNVDTSLNYDLTALKIEPNLIPPPPIVETTPVPESNTSPTP